MLRKFLRKQERAFPLVQTGHTAGRQVVCSFAADAAVVSAFACYCCCFRPLGVLLLMSQTVPWQEESGVHAVAYVTGCEQRIALMCLETSSRGKT